MLVRVARPAQAALILMSLGLASAHAERDSFPESYPAFWKEWQQRPYGDAWMAARQQEQAAREAAEQAQYQHPHPHHAPLAPPAPSGAHGNAAYAEELAAKGRPGDSHVTAAHAQAHPEHTNHEHANHGHAHDNGANNFNVAGDRYHECATLLQRSANRVDNIESRLLAGTGYQEVQPAQEAPAVVAAQPSAPTELAGLPIAETYPVQPGQVVDTEYVEAAQPSQQVPAQVVTQQPVDFTPAPKASVNRIDYPDGSFYRGDISAERRHGYGVMTWPDGTRYLGQFFNDQYHGHGQLKWSDGTSYTGSFLHDQLEGRGTIVWQDGLKFQGEMETNQRHGKGTYTLPDGRRVVGVFTNDRPAGTGILIYPDGRHEPVHFGKDVNIKHNPLKFCNYASMPGCP